MVLSVLCITPADKGGQMGLLSWAQGRGGRPGPSLNYSFLFAFFLTVLEIVVKIVISVLGLKYIHNLFIGLNYI